METLEDLLRGFGYRDAVVARELTKKFEEIKRGRLAEMIAHFKQGVVRGEFVVVVAGTPEPGRATRAGIGQEKIIEELLKLNLPKKQIAGLVAKLSGKSKRDIYKQLVGC